MKSLILNARTSLLECDGGNGLFAASAAALSCRWTMHMNSFYSKQSIHQCIPDTTTPPVSNVVLILLLLIYQKPEELETTRERKKLPKRQQTFFSFSRISLIGR